MSEMNDQEWMHALAVSGARVLLNALEEKRDRFLESLRLEREKILEKFPELRPKPKARSKSSDATVIFDAADISEVDAAALAKTPDPTHPRRFTPELRETVVQRIAGGETVQSVADAYRLEQSTVRGWCAKAHVTPPSVRVDMTVDTMSWLQRRNAPTNVADAAMALNLSMGAAEQRLRILMIRGLVERTSKGIYELTDAGRAWVPPTDGAPPRAPGVHAAPGSRERGLEMLKEGRTRADVARELNVSETSVRRWSETRQTKKKKK